MTQEPEHPRRWVFLRHEMQPDAERSSHYDLMIERMSSENASLESWACEELLFAPADAQRVSDIRKLADHRIDYLDYEGEISGNRGSVRRLSQGVVLQETGSGNLRRFRLRDSSGAEWKLELDEAMGSCRVVHDFGG